MNQYFRKWSDPALLICAISIATIAEFVNSAAWRRPALGAMLAMSLVTRSYATLPATLVLFLMYTFGLFAPRALHNLPAVGFLIPFLISAAILYAIRPARFNLQWFRRGYIDRTSWFLVSLTGVCSTLALAAWAYWTNNLGAGAQMMAGLASVPHWLLFGVYLPLFALVNAFAEEVVYRGLIQQALTNVFQSRAIVLVVQAIAFAAVHYGSGFPNGVIGFCMVFVYALMLGYLRIRTKGFLAPYIAHVIADATIAGLLFTLAQ